MYVPNRFDNATMPIENVPPAANMMLGIMRTPTWQQDPAYWWVAETRRKRGLL